MLRPDLLGALNTYAKDCGATLSGMVVFGSFARSDQDKLSDVDLLIVSRPACEVPALKDKRFDTEYVSTQQLRDSLDSRKWRDNVLLLALSSGVVCFDVDGDIANLKTCAEQLWVTGTGPLSHSQLSRLYKGAARATEAALNLVSRPSAASPGVAGLAKLELCAIHLSLNAISLRCAQKWVYDPWVVRHIDEPVYRELAAVTRWILESDQSLLMSQRIQAFGSTVMKRIDLLQHAG